MSRTRIVKGNITKIVGGNYKVFSKENIENYSEKKMIQIGKENGVSYGEPEKPPIFSGNFVIDGEWLDKDGKLIDQSKSPHAKIGETIFFRVKTQNIPQNTPLLFELWEHDGISIQIILGTIIDTRAFDDYIPLETKEAGAKSIAVNVDKNGYATISVALTEVLEKYIEEDTGAYIELYFIVRYIGYEPINYLPRDSKKYLKVGYSDRTLFIKTAIEEKNYPLPEIYSHSGDIILFAIQEVPEPQLQKFIKLKVRTTTDFKFHEDIKKLKKELYTETINLGTNTIENYSYTIEDIEYPFNIKDDGGKVFIDEKFYEIPVAEGSKIAIYNSLKNSLKITKDIGKFYDHFLILDEMKNMIPEISTNGKFNLPSLSTLVGFIPGGGVLAFGFAISEWIVKDMVKQYDEWLEEGIELEMERLKRKGLFALEFGVLNNSFLKEKYTLEKNVPRSTLNKLLKGQIKTLEQFRKIKQSDISGEIERPYQNENSFVMMTFSILIKIELNKEKGKMNDFNYLIEAIFYEK